MAAGHKKPHPLQLLLGAAGWSTFFRQHTLLPGVSLALLYFTVLSLGFLMTSWLAFQVSVFGGEWGTCAVS
jgi:ABC-type sulfate transport system permease subunit